MNETLFPTPAFRAPDYVPEGYRQQWEKIARRVWKVGMGKICLEANRLLRQTEKILQTAGAPCACRG